ncbi:hypothetical protein CEP54_016265, partial [Fusarium duplospermum]
MNSTIFLLIMGDLRELTGPAAAHPQMRRLANGIKHKSTQPKWPVITSQIRTPASTGSYDLLYR